MNDRYNEDYPTRKALKAHLENRTIHQQVTPLTHNRSIAYSPEYKDAIIEGNAVVEPRPYNDFGTGWSNTYFFGTDSETQVSSTVDLDFTIPLDFSAWALNAIAIEFCTTSTTTTNCKIDLEVYKYPSGTPLWSASDLTSADDETIEAENITSTNLATGSTTWTTGDILHLKITVSCIANYPVSLQRIIFYYSA